MPIDERYHKCIVRNWVKNRVYIQNKKKIDSPSVICPEKVMKNTKECSLSTVE